ncbi:MAG: putative rane protein [Clostridiaceae bacterium]|jgi:hypothetical protein|nr:putative rane protein [Clostridiaceae bacterium]
MENVLSENEEQDLNSLISKISNYEIGQKEAEEKIKNFFISEKDYNHSNILLTLTELQGESLDFLQMFLDGISAKEIIDNYEAGLKFKEFYDFVSTEMVRISSIRQINEKTDFFKNDLESYKDVLSGYENTINELSKQIQRKEEQLSSINNNHISVLGIFAGIVMVFFSGLSFVSDSEKYFDISILRLTFIICLIGFIMFNSIFILIYFVAKMTSSDIRVKCRKCTDQIALICDNCEKDVTSEVCDVGMHCKPIEKLINLYPVLFYVNFILIIFISIDFLVWTYLNQYYILTVGTIISMLISLISLFYKARLI